jgi:uncharacterized protein YdiU (UPF0061 family)
MKKLFENWNKFLNESDAWRSSLFSHMQGEKQATDNIVNDLIDKSEFLKSVIDKYPEYEDKLRAGAHKEVFSNNMEHARPEIVHREIIMGFSEALKDIDYEYSQVLSQKYFDEAARIIRDSS